MRALYHRSGWTQDELAKVEGCDRSKMARRLLFGRFLANVPNGTKPKNLTEGRFRILGPVGPIPETSPNGAFWHLLPVGVIPETSLNVASAATGRPPRRTPTSGLPARAGAAVLANTDIGVEEGAPRARGGGGNA